MITIGETISALVTPETVAAYHATQDKALYVQCLLEGANIPARIDGPRVEYLERLLEQYSPA